MAGARYPGWWRKSEQVIKVIEKKDPKIYVQRSTPPNDYLKYYKVVRYWVRFKYGLHNQDFELIQYLYTQRFFSKRKYEQYCNIFEWSKKRFPRLKREGWIREFRPRTAKQHAVYELSSKGKKMMRSVYRKLNGEETFSELKAKNPVFDRSCFQHKTFAMEMVRMNKDTRKRQLEQAKLMRESQKQLRNRKEP